MRLGSGLLAIVALGLMPSQATASCTDAQAVVAARAEVDATCDCAGAASHGAYVRCARDVVRRRSRDGLLPSGCRSDVRRCAARSTCGRPGAVACCTDQNGAARCRVEVDAARCAERGGTPSSCAHCCDACTIGCSTTSTSVTTSSTSSTITSSTVPTPCGNTLPECNGSCPPDQFCVNFGGALCNCVANHCSGGAYPECGGSCPPGKTCFNSAFSCECYDDTCSGSACTCVQQPPFPGCSCRPGFNCGFCSEVQDFFCFGAPCATVADCPPGGACQDLSVCGPP